MIDQVKQLLQAYQQAQDDREWPVLATIVHTAGSTYRQAGAKMLITSSGQLSGMVTGGCLEQDIIAHAQLVGQTHQPRLVTYDHRAAEDLLWGFGLGCDGKIQIWMEPLSPGPLNPLANLQQCWLDRQPRAIATVYSVDDGGRDLSVTAEALPQAGQRLVVLPDHTTLTNIVPTGLTTAIAIAVKQRLAHGQSGSQVFSWKHQTVTVWLDILQPPPQLLLFGSGRDAVPVMQLAQGLGWQVILVDCRASEATPTRFAQADEVILTQRDRLAAQVALPVGTIAVVMTHNYLDDRAILRHLLPAAPRYVGVLGARQRTAQLLQDLAGELSPQLLQSPALHTPIGLDIGAETPEAIALAIVAEIQAVLSGRSAGFLHQRQGAIHATNDRAVVNCPT